MTSLEQSVFSELTLFVCTYIAKLGNIKIKFDELTHIICNNLSGNILAVNSNFGNASQIGYEHFIKYPKQSSKCSIYTKGKVRKIQGNGTCFNSAVEPVIKIKSNPIKNYFIKCFPTTGETQIPGVINPDLSDGHEVLIEFINYLNNLNIGIDGKDIYIISEGPKMLNYKFRLNREDNSILINLFSVTKYLQYLENNILNCEEYILIKPPYTIREIKSPIDDIKLSFRIQTSEKRLPRVNIFQEGKVNILGIETTDSVKLIYTFINEIFRHNWVKFINIKPKKDKDL